MVFRKRNMVVLNNLCVKQHIFKTLSFYCITLVCDGVYEIEVKVSTFPNPTQHNTHPHLNVEWKRNHAIYSTNTYPVALLYTFPLLVLLPSVISRRHLGLSSRDTTRIYKTLGCSKMARATEDVPFELSCASFLNSKMNIIWRDTTQSYVNFGMNLIWLYTLFVRYFKTFLYLTLLFI